MQPPVPRCFSVFWLCRLSPRVPAATMCCCVIRWDPGGHHRRYLMDTTRRRRKAPASHRSKHCLPVASPSSWWKLQAKLPVTVRIARAIPLLPLLQFQPSRLLRNESRRNRCSQLSRPKTSFNPPGSMCGRMGFVNAKFIFRVRYSTLRGSEHSYCSTDGHGASTLHDRTMARRRASPFVDSASGCRFFCGDCTAEWSLMPCHPARPLL